MDPLLVDTHCWLWLQTEPRRFNPRILALLADTDVPLWLSVASLWEIAIKHALGKLPLPQPPQVYVPRRMLSSGCEALPIEPPHALAVAALPHHHGDPFDRMLIAQAQHEGVRLLTVDRQLAAYDVDILWADADPEERVQEPSRPSRTRPARSRRIRS